MKKLNKSQMVAIALWFYVLSAPAALASTRRALVFGNDSYPGNELHNARNDARSVADALKLDGYQTTLGLDLNRRSMVTAIENFAQATNPGDVVVFYYAGHGLQLAGENYLVPTDFVVTTPGDVKTEGVALSSVLEQLSVHGATTQIVILDACRDNPFLGTRSLHGGWASIGTSAGTFLAFGTSPGSTASDDPSKPHGLFTLELLKYLTTSHLDIEQMFQQVRLDVIEQSHGEQVPWTASSLVGTFHILPQLDMSIPPISSELSAFPSTPTSDEEPRSVSAPVSGADSTIGADSTFGASSHAEGSPTDAVGMPVTLVQAAAAIQEGDTKSAISILQALLAENPKDSSAARLLALALQSVGQESEAVSVLSRELSLFPNDAEALLDRCVVEGDLNPATSIRDCEGAVELDPGSSAAHVALADTLFMDGQVKRAYDEAARAIQIAPTQSLAFALRGQIAASQGYSSIAHEDYQRAMNAKLAETPLKQ